MGTTRIRLIVALWALSAASALASAQVALPTPLPGTYVHDFAGVVADDKEAEIQAKALRLKNEYRTEVAVVTVDSLQGKESFSYSMQMARSWGIGSPDNDVRGVLILVAVKDRKTAFRTSRHIEGELPDGVTGEISREMNAYFKKGDFGGGLSAGLDQILARLREVYEPRPAAAAQPATTSSFTLDWLWLPIVVAPALGLGYAVLRRRGRQRRGARTTGRAAGGGFRAWASRVDPTPVPKPLAKAQQPGHPNAAQRRSPVKEQKSSSQNIPFLLGYDSETSSYDSASSSYDPGSSSSYDSGSDSGSSYSGGSDFGGGGSDSSW